MKRYAFVSTSNTDTNFLFVFFTLRRNLLVLLNFALVCQLHSGINANVRHANRISPPARVGGEMRFNVSVGSAGSRNHPSRGVLMIAVSTPLSTPPIPSLEWLPSSTNTTRQSQGFQKGFATDANYETTQI